MSTQIDMPRAARVLWVGAIAVLSCGASREAQAAGTLYGISPFYSTQYLYTISTDTGTVSNVGATGVNLLIGLAADSHGRLLSVDALVGSTRKLYELNPATGQATVLFNLGATNTFYEGGFAIDPTTNLGYIVEEDDLYRINLSTGTLTALGNITLNGSQLGASKNIDGLAFRQGTLYGIITRGAGALDQHLIRIDKATLAMSDVGSTGLALGYSAGLAYNPSADIFYLGGKDSAGLYAVNPVTAAATLIGNHGLSDLSGLEFVVPEPATLSLLAVGGLAIMRRRW